MNEYLYTSVDDWMLMKPKFVVLLDGRVGWTRSDNDIGERL